MIHVFQTWTAKKIVNKVDPIRRMKINRTLVNLSRDPSKIDIIYIMQGKYSTHQGQKLDLAFKDNKLSITWNCKTQYKECWSTFASPRLNSFNRPITHLGASTSLLAVYHFMNDDLQYSTFSPKNPPGFSWCTTQ